MDGRVGKKDEENSDIIGIHGENERNNNVARVINFCILTELIVIYTFYQHKDSYKCTTSGEYVKDVRVMRMRIYTATIFC